MRAHLITRLTSLGYTVREAPFALADKSKQRLVKFGSPPVATGTNIIAIRPGGDPAAPMVMLMAHHDTVGGSPGAADDSTGVAAALEIARALQPVTMKRSLAIVLTDGEELGLDGARHFFAGDPLAKQIGMIVNMESRGGGGRATMFETGRGNGDGVALLQASVRNPSANSLGVKIYELLPNDTDLSPAKKAGFAGYNFAYIGRARLYHSPLATPDAIDQGALQHIGAQALDLTRALVTAPALPARTPDAIFSDVLGLFVVSHSVAAGWGLVALAAVLIAVAFRRGGARPAAVLAGAGRGLAFMLLTGGLLWAGNALSGAGLKPNYYDRLAALPLLETQAALLIAAALAIVAATAGREADRRGNWLGLALLNLGLAAAVHALLPAATPVMLWPLLVALVPLALSGAARPPLLLAGGAAAVALAQVGGFAHQMLLAVGGPMPWAVILFAPLTLLLLWPLLPEVRRARGLWVAAVLLAVTAAGIAMTVRTAGPAPSRPPYSDKS